MARRSVGLSPIARDNIVAAPVSNIQAALIQASTNYSNFNALLVDASARFIAIPPVVNPLRSDVFSMHLLLSGMPGAVSLYRDDEFHLAFNSAVSTQTGAWFAGGVERVLALDPALAGDTLAVVSVVGTSPLRVNWLQIP